MDAMMICGGVSALMGAVVAWAVCSAMWSRRFHRAMNLPRKIAAADSALRDAQQIERWMKRRSIALGMSVNYDNRWLRIPDYKKVTGVAWGTHYWLQTFLRCLTMMGCELEIRAVADNDIDEWSAKTADEEREEFIRLRGKVLYWDDMSAESKARMR